MTVKTVSFLVLGALALTACAQPARAPLPVGTAASAAPLDRLVAAIEAEGCVLDGGNSGAVQLRANLRRDDVTQLMQQLVAQGRVEAITTANGSAIRLLSDNCI
jgi:hypothetical protein